MRVEAPLRYGLALLAEFDDVVRGRVAAWDDPGFWDDRGWRDFLLGLSDDALAQAECEGLGAILGERSEVPSSLGELTRRARHLVEAIPSSGEAGSGTPPPVMHAVPLRKRHQIRALLDALSVGTTDRYDRLVDLGAGRGHFTRRAGQALGVFALGVERDPGRVAAARRLAGDDATFVRADALGGDVELTSRDLVVGLHACGELGDHTVVAAIAAGSDVVVVSCCLQKIRAPARSPLSSIAIAAGFAPDRAVLGLSNLYPSADGVEVTLEATMSARAHRASLRWLLERRIGSCAPGDEMRGINRRWPRRGLPALAARACELRGLSPPTPAELDDADRAGRQRLAAARRLSLPRAALARPLEITIALDRARYAEEQDYAVRVTTFVDAAHSPRNLALFAIRGA